jgi:hypothetical protein
MTKEQPMDTDAISFNQPTGPRPPSRRDVLWDELAQLHQQFGIEPPTVTYTREALQAEVTLARRAVHQPASKGRTQFNSMPFDAPREGGGRRPHTLWRNFYAAVFVPERPTPEPYQSTPSEDES